MKQILFPLWLGLLFSHISIAQTIPANQDSEPYHTSRKLYPAITISPSQHSNGYYRDANGFLQEYEGNTKISTVDHSSAYHRMLTRNQKLTENKFTILDREINNARSKNESLKMR